MGPAAEVCAWRPVQVWRALMDWVAFVGQIIVQIARGAQFALSHIGLATLPLPSLLAFFSSSSTSFKPLPSVELSLHDSNSSPHVCVDSCAGEDNGHEDDHRVEKLTVSIYLVCFSFCLCVQVDEIDLSELFVNRIITLHSQLFDWRIVKVNYTTSLSICMNF